MKTVIQIILVVLIGVVGFLVWESIQKPIRFNTEQKRRYDATVQRLKDIREAQIAYRSENKKFTGSFDTLIKFLRTDSFRVVRIIGDVDRYETAAEVEQAKKSGEILQDTINVSVLDSLFRKRGYHAGNIDSIRYVPFSDGKTFEMGAGNVKAGNAGNVIVNVFEAKVLFEELMKGMDEQLLYNFITEKTKRTGYAGLRVGSLDEATNNAGNWE